MTTPEQQGSQQGNPQGGSEQRSENLLPADGDDGKDDGQGDGQFSVAEEVNLDEQGDMARRVGQPPKGIAGDALADSLKDDAAGDKPAA